METSVGDGRNVNGDTARVTHSVDTGEGSAITRRVLGIHGLLSLSHMSHLKTR